MARKGAAAMEHDGSEKQPDRERAAPQRSSEEWVREDSRPAPRKQRRKTSESTRLSDVAVGEIESSCGRQAPRILRYLSQAVAAYSAERWSDANKALRPVLTAAGDVPSVRELHGMILYRTGKWAKALEQLTAAHLATHTHDLYPAMMDCNRALRRHNAVHELWAELRDASPSAEVTSEGRIVEAGTLADEGELRAGITLLEKAPRPRSKPKEHHMRTWYALGDLYERSSDLARAREVFSRVADHDPDLADVLERIEALGGPADRG